MSLMHWLAGIVSLALGVYLVVALLAPEKLS